MPLEKSSSKTAFVRNLKTEICAGKPQDQALAIAYSEKRRAKRADGGGLSETDEAAMMPETFVPPGLADWSRQAAPKDAAIARGLLSGVATLPQRAIEASAQDVSHFGDHSYEPQLTGPALETAMMMMGTGLPMAEKGAAGVFGGRLSKVADHGAITKAEQMEAARATPDAIWNEVKTARGADKAWRQEIDDSQSSLKIKPSELKAAEIDPRHLSRSGDFVKSSYLDDVLDHPGLYQAYPHLRDITIEPLSARDVAEGVRGSYRSNTIQLSPKLTPEQGRSTLLHEVQHAIQDAEGFARGDNPANHIPAELAPARQQFESVRANTQAEIAQTLNTNDLGVEYMKDLIRREKYGSAAALREIPEPFVDVFEKIIAKHPDITRRLRNLVDSEKMLSDADQAAYARYRAAMGEVEARNVQNRIGNNGELAPHHTEDIPRSQQRAKGGQVNKALNIAYEARRQARADGGGVFEGPIISDVPGRTDKHPMDVAAGSYVIPAESVSHMGENNTLAGMKHLRQIGPQGIRKLALAAKGAHDIASKHRVKRALGGAAGEDEKSAGHATPIVAAGGEVVLSPEEVRVIGNGDIELGHRLLDNWIIRGRRDHIKTLQGLAPPARD